jgi:lysophospholipase L1-like esterase
MRSLKTKAGSFTWEELLGKAIKEGGFSGKENLNSSINIPVSGSITLSNTAIDLTPIEIAVVENAVISANKFCSVQFQMISGPTNGSLSRRYYVGPGVATVPFKELWYGVPNIQLREGDGTPTYNVSATVNGYRITADLNFNADKVMMWIGDSITRGSSMGATVISGGQPAASTNTPEDHFAFQVRNHFQRRGIDCRLVVKAMGGFTSRNMGVWLKQGWLDIEQCDVIFYQLGVNDASGTTTDGEFQTELDRIVDFRDRKFPSAKLVFVGDSPLNNNTNETRLATLRGLKSAMASTPDNIYYVSLASAFDRSVLTNYTSSDGVHPNIASNALMAGVIETWIDANSITF